MDACRIAEQAVDSRTSVGALNMIFLVANKEEKVRVAKVISAYRCVHAPLQRRECVQVEGKSEETARENEANVDNALMRFGSHAES